MSERGFFERIFGNTNNEKVRPSENVPGYRVEREHAPRQLTVGTCLGKETAKMISEAVRAFSRGEKVALVIATMGIGAGAGYLIEHGDEAVKSGEAYLFEDAMTEGLDDLHAKAGSQLRSNEAMRGEFTSEQIEATAQALEKFDAKIMLEKLSSRSGLSSHELVSRWNLKEIVVYGKAACLESEGEAAGGYYDGKTGRIILNLSDVITVTGGDPEMIEPVVLDMIYHENLHAIGYMSRFSTFFGQWMYEGQTELLTNELYSDIHGEKNPILGNKVVTAANELIYSQLNENEQKAYWSGYLTMDHDLARDAIDGAFGEGALGRLVGVDTSPLADIQKAASFGRDADTYQQGLFLARALEIVREEKRDEAIKMANDRLGEYLIVRLNSHDYEGVALLYRGNEKVKLINGLVIDNEEPEHRVLLKELKNFKTTLAHIPETNVDVIGFSMRDQTVEGAAASMNTLISDYLLTK